MSDHAAVKEEHRKLAKQITDLFGLPDMVGNRLPLLQLLADFARDARVKEAELWKRRVGSDSAGYGTSTAEWTHGRIAQLKRGEA